MFLKHLPGVRPRLGLAAGMAALAFLAFQGSISVAGAVPVNSGYGPQSNLPFGGLHDPNSIALNPDADVYLLDNNGTNSHVLFIQKTHSGYASQVDLPFGGLHDPLAIAVDSIGDVFLADPGRSAGSRVLEIQMRFGVYLPQVSLPPVGIDNPTGLAVDRNGNVYVVDGNGVSSSVWFLPKVGSSFGTPSQLPFGGLNEPNGVAVDARGNVYLADTLNDRVLILPKISSGVYGPQANLPLGGLSIPHGVAVDGNGNVYVADGGRNRVLFLQRFTIGGGDRIVTGYDPQVTLPIGGLANPQSVAVDGNGNVYVADFANARAVFLPKLGH